MPLIQGRKQSDGGERTLAVDDDGKLLVGGITVDTVTVTDAATETKQDTIITALGTPATKLDTLIAQGTTPAP
jgi:hypothetical protein